MPTTTSTNNTDATENLILAFGGKPNIINIDACFTRLRIKLIDVETADQNKIKELGATKVVVVDDEVQAIFGRKSDQLKNDMQEWIFNNFDAKLADEIVIAYGGKENIINVGACMTRLNIKVKDTQSVDQDRLKKLGAVGVVVVNNAVQAIFGKQSDKIKANVQQSLSK